MKKKIFCIVGTRPETIKMAPLIDSLKKTQWADIKTIATAQHREMLDEALAIFKITPDFDFSIMEHNQSLSQLTAKLLVKLDELYLAEQPDGVIAQGDTTTTFVAALAAFYRNIPFYHVEAGLRTKNFRHPFPEEANRVITDRLSSLCFAPTETSKKNLLREGISPAKIHITGNTIVDALLFILKQNNSLKFNLNFEKRIVLVTAHRRENFGAPLLEICKAIKRLARSFQDIQIVYPVHMNPNVSRIVHEQLTGDPNIVLTPPLDYKTFITLMQKAYLVLTDSGGVQEEAPALGVPVLVMREKTERPEGIKAGAAKLVGRSASKIFNSAYQLLSDYTIYEAMQKKQFIYGNGTAAVQIADLIGQALRK